MLDCVRVVEAIGLDLRLSSAEREKAQRALPFTSGFLKMAAGILANDQTYITY